MTFFAEASIHVPVSPEVAFDALADHANWPAWMPTSFMPVGPSSGTLRAGQRILVRIAHGPMASPIDVRVVDRPREIAWGGGVRGLVDANHRFLFEGDGSGGTTIRSVESWNGVLATLLRPVLKRVAERIGAAQLAGIARAVQGKAG